MFIAVAVIGLIFCLFTKDDITEEELNARYYKDINRIKNM
jgi:hypothetical protein